VKKSFYDFIAITIMGRPLFFCILSFCLFLLLAPDRASCQEAWLPGAIVYAQRNASPAAGDAVSAADQTPGQPRPGFLSWVWQSLTDEAHITAGVGILQSTLTVERQTDGARAKLVQRDESAFFLSYSTRPSFFKDSNFGYTFMVNYVSFDMKKQELPNDVLADVGTEVRGNMIYAVPTLYYQWGEHRYNGTFVRLGVGVGVGAATYEGTVQLSSGETVATKNHSYAPRLTFSDFLEARWHHFGISLSYAAPRIYGDEYDIKVTDFSVSAGYTYYF
jgi:hypothetical protein